MASKSFNYSKYTFYAVLVLVVLTVAGLVLPSSFGLKQERNLAASIMNTDGGVSSDVPFADVSSCDGEAVFGLSPEFGDDLLLAQIFFAQGRGKNYRGSNMTNAKRGAAKYSKKCRSGKTGRSPSLIGQPCIVEDEYGISEPGKWVESPKNPNIVQCIPDIVGTSCSLDPLSILDVNNTSIPSTSNTGKWVGKNELGYLVVTCSASTTGPLDTGKVNPYLDQNARVPSSIDKLKCFFGDAAACAMVRAYKLQAPVQ